MFIHSFIHFFRCFSCIDLLIISSHAHSHVNSFPDLFPLFPCVSFHPLILPLSIWAPVSSHMISSFILSFVHSLLTHSFIAHSFITSFMHLFQDSLVHSFTQQFMGFPVGSDCKESACNAGDLGSIPGSGRSFEEGIGYPLQYSCLGNPMDRGAWRATVPGFTKSQT